METDFTKCDTALLFAHQQGYKITRDGNVISPRGKLLKKLTGRNGYFFFNVRLPRYLGGGVKHVYVHRLQAYQIFGDIVITNKIVEVMHNDNDKTNNHYKNISIGTHKKNCENTPKYKLWHIDQRTPVACQRGDVINHFPSIYEASKFTGVNSGSISKCCNGKICTAGGLSWWILPKIKPIGTYK